MYQLVLNEKINRIRALPDLPPLPAVAQQILGQVTSEQVDIPRLSKTIEQDPALFGRIIGVANSAYFGCPDRIYTVSQAIVRVLGLNMVKSLALGIVLNEPFKQSSCHGFDLKQHWFQSMFTAMLCRWMARYVTKTDRDFSDQVYLAGLLSKLGELVLTHLFPSEMSDVYARQQIENDIDVLDLQAEIIGISSLEASAILAKKWHLPVSLQTLYRHFHASDYQGPHWQLVHLVRLCSHLAHQQEPVEIDEQAALIDITQRLALDPIHLTRLVKKIPAIRQDVECLAAVLA
jgi:HD-like signal output (HDOD) protein